MAKTSGGVRTYRQGSSTYLKRQAEVEAMRASGKYSSIEMSKGGPSRRAPPATCPKSWKRLVYSRIRGTR